MSAYIAAIIASTNRGHPSLGMSGPFLTVTKRELMRKCCAILDDIEAEHRALRERLVDAEIVRRTRANRQFWRPSRWRLSTDRDVVRRDLANERWADNMVTDWRAVRVVRGRLKSICQELMASARTDCGFTVEVRVQDWAAVARAFDALPH